MSLKFSEQETRFLLFKRQQLINACLVCKGKSCPVCTKPLELYYKMAQAHIPMKFWDREVTDLDDPKVAQYVTKYINNLDRMLREGTGFYLYGKNGLGKSLAAAIIGKEALRRGYRVLFSSLSEVLSMYCNKLYDEHLQKQFSSSILRVDFLILDDIDKAYNSEKTSFIDSAYDELFRTRANLCLPVIVTANVKRKEVTEGHGVFGPTLLSRFNEHLVDVLVMGADRRQQRREEMERFFNE